MAEKLNLCPFCETLNTIKSLNEREFKKPFENTYSAILRNETYYKGTLRGSTRHGGFDLNYCPTCGKSLKGA